VNGGKDQYVVMGLRDDGRLDELRLGRENVPLLLEEEADEPEPGSSRGL
jgi:hypothetical protein